MRRTTLSQMTETKNNTTMPGDDEKKKPLCVSWSGRTEFFTAQFKVAAILLLAYVGDRWEPSYKRNDNHNMTMFWAGHVALLIGAAVTWKRREPRAGSTRVTLLSRPQTEEWKGWMQFAFIMYHYYRAYTAYNWIRVFVSSYVWMTGFGNFLYFDKKKDFSLERMVSMFIRINYFPLLLSWCTGVSLDLYYVVPLHTVGFFMTLLTCFLAVKLEEVGGLSYWKSRILAVSVSLLVHIIFYETTAVDSLLFFSKEIHFRFQADKYSAWAGIASGMLMGKATEYMTWAYGGSTGRPLVGWAQRIGGALLIFIWYNSFGWMPYPDRESYNLMHPYIFILPLFGWLAIRNSSKYLTESHSEFLEFLGRNTLETYVLQFHLFMNHSVQYIPIVIPGSGPEGNDILRFLNMLVCGIVFVSVAVQARKVTVSTQTSCTELVVLIRNKCKKESLPVGSKEEFDEEITQPILDEDKK